MKLRARVLLATAGTLLMASAPAAAVVPQDLALRLTDLDPGYVVENETCEPASLADDGPSDFVRQIGRLHHVGCRIGFQREWTTPGTPLNPWSVSSYVFVFESTDGPETAMTHPHDVVEHLAIDAPPVVQPAPDIGDEAVLMHGELRMPGRHVWWTTTVLWRAGNVLAAVNTISPRGADASLQAALRLATVQQARIASPTPLGPEDNDDAEVGLDTPGIRLPIYWLGHDLAPRGRLPGLSLDSSQSQRVRGRQAMVLDYSDDQLRIFVTRPSLLRLPAFRRESRRLARDPCTRGERVTLPSGHATIWSQHAGRCHAKADTAFAIARLSGVVVFVGLDSEQPVSPSVARYATRTGMLRLLRALHRRKPTPPPVSTTPSPG